MNLPGIRNLAVRAFGAAALAHALAAPVAGADPRPLAAQVIWVREPRVYLAAADSLPLGPGARLTLYSGDRAVANARIERVIDEVLAVALLTDGSLAGVPRDRLRVGFEPAAQPRLAVLRVGGPASGRGHPLIACPRTLPVAPPGLHAAPARSRAQRFVRAADDSLGAWPDTVEVRLYDDAADQEIALARGDIDVALFWPGEPSRHLRESPPWRSVAWACRETLAVVLPAGRTGFDVREMGVLVRLNNELFRGDLAWVPAGLEGVPAAGAPPLRFEADPSLPGRALVERVLAGQRAPAARRAAAARLGLRDRLPAALRPAAVPAFALRCPVVAAPGVRASVEALGPDLLFGLIGCGPGRAP